MKNKKAIRRATDIVRLQHSLNEELRTPASLLAAQTVESTLVAYLERALPRGLKVEAFLADARDTSKQLDFGLMMAGDQWRPILNGCSAEAWDEIVDAMNRLFEGEEEWVEARDWRLKDGTPTREPAITYIVCAEPKLEVGGIYDILTEILRAEPPTHEPELLNEEEYAAAVKEQEADEKSYEEAWADDINGTKKSED